MGLQVAGITDNDLGKLTKGQAMAESGIAPSMGHNQCGGQNCGIWAISAGSVTGDPPGGPCGSTATDPLTGQVDYSHSYGLFQDTPACDSNGFGLVSSLPSGVQCTPTTTADYIPFGPQYTYYCETAEGVNGQYVDAVQDTSDPNYAKSVFNPAYQIYAYFSEWSGIYQQGNSAASGCSTWQTWYLTMAAWNTGSPSNSCTLSGQGLAYVQGVVGDYKTLYGSAWPHPFP